MVQITLLGREFDVAPYKIGALRKAAPFIEKVNATAGGTTTMSGGLEVVSDMIGLVAIGLVKADPVMTAARLEDDLGFEDIPAVQAAFMAILNASGFKSGEAKAPSMPADQEAASTTISADLSPSLSPPA